MSKKNKGKGKKCEQDRELKISNTLSLLGGVESIYAAVTDADRGTDSKKKQDPKSEEVASKCLDQFSRILDVLGDEIGDADPLE